MQKELGLIASLGIIGSIVSIISLIVQLQNVLGGNVHYVYILLFVTITIYSASKFKKLTKENFYLKSPDEKIKTHIRKFPFDSASNSSTFVSFIEASKSFTVRNKDFFRSDFDNIIAVAENGVRDTHRKDIMNIGNYVHALALKSKIEAHLTTINEK